MTIVNDDSRVVTKLETSVTDKSGVVIYDRHMFIVQATGLDFFFKFVIFCFFLSPPIRNANKENYSISRTNITKFITSVICE